MTKTIMRIEDEIRQYEKHVANFADVTVKLETVLKTAFEKYHAEFVQQQKERLLSLPVRFLEKRNPNETVEEWVKRDLKWPEAVNNSPEAAHKREMIFEAIKWWEGVMFWLTDHPIQSNRHAEWANYTPEEKSPGNWEDSMDRDEWIDIGAERKPFQVKMRDDASELAKKYAEQLAKQILKTFIYKATSKVLPILKRNGSYYAGLEKCRFNLVGIEADVRITFVDTRSFVLHVILKNNTSSLGKDFYQYPLTYHDIYAGNGAQLVKSMSQNDIETMFNVKDEDRWEPSANTPTKQLRSCAARVGDVVKFHGKKVTGLITNIKKGTLRVLFENNEESNVSLGKVASIVTRINVVYDKMENDGGKDLFAYTLLNKDGSVTGPSYLNKSQSSILEKMFNKETSGNYKVEGAKIVFQFLCQQSV